ncbi:MAG TPA: copper resistance protein CopC [Solirubrobacter sp.]|nr:copper resistance protein CopC [Solirubrobacter sp.]
MIARALIAALALLLFAAPTAGAHATLERSSPADGTQLEAAPATVTMHFSEPVQLGPGAIQLLNAAGDELKTAKPRAQGADVALTLPRGLTDGTYVVAWRVTSADSHPVSGAFSFSVGDASPAVLVQPGERQASEAVKLADGIARGVAFAGFALAVGGACVLLLLWPEGRASARGRRVVAVGLSALLAGSLALLLLQGPYAGGGGLLDALKPSLLSFSVSTPFGQALLVRIALALAFAVLVARAVQRPSTGLLAGAAACAVALVFTWTLTDHSHTGVQTWLGVPAASAHLLAMALWLGGLTLLLACVLGRRAQASLLPVVPRFSRMALVCFAVLAATGVYLAWRQSGALAALPATGFGRLLLIKLGIVLAIVGLAALSRRAVQRADGDLGRRLRRSVAAEVALGVVVLGVTASLVNAEPARTAYAPPVDVTRPAPGGGHVQVHVEPAKQGDNVADVYLVGRGGRLLMPPEVTAKLQPPPGRGLGALPVELGAAEPGHYVAPALTVPFPGAWTLRITVRTSEFDEDVVDVPIEIR